MKNKTLKELRDLAKARGLKGYSKLAKDELIRQLVRRESTDAPAAAKATGAVAPTAKTAGDHGKVAKTAPAGPAPRANPVQTTVAPVTNAAEPVDELPLSFASSEEQVEGAKYALRPHGRLTTSATADLDEDIDTLPALTESLVCLLAQKPGVLHAYWVLPSGETASRGDYKLRLCHGENESLNVQEEVPVRDDRGSWYFHVREPAGGTALLVQLGYYENGRFVAARGRSIARLPSLYASTRTDQRWWVEEADFARMYVRAGGMVTPAREFGWAASVGSPSGAPSASSEQVMAWPGNASRSS